MKKIILIPDSFKGTMSSAEICGIMESRIKQYYPDAEILKYPVADGGEGSVDAFLTALGGEKVYLTVKGPYMEDVDCYYGLIENGRTAVIEMAACAGLPLVGDNRCPDKTTTFGVGQLIENAALEKGCKKIILCIGGSATNEMGAGAAAALGIDFYDESENRFVPVGGTLSKIKRIDKSRMLSCLHGVEFITMCDINNPLYGENGAAYVFSPQKGADAEMVKFLDGQLMAASDAIKRELSIDVSNIPGAGAAGGMGGGTVAFFNSKLQMGIETILETVNFDEAAKAADLIITGEGKLDKQSLSGKVVIGVARRAKKLDVPVVAIVGDIGDDIEAVYEEGVSAVFSINRVAVDFSEAKKRSRSDLDLTIDNLCNFMKKMSLHIM